MPDTVLPPAATPDTTKEPARIGTSNDKSWAGWAISSFTNKMASAEGEIQPTTNGSKPADTNVRPASVPRPAKPSPSTQLHPPKETRNAPPLGRTMSEQPAHTTKEMEEEEEEADDVFEAWGAMDDDDEEARKSEDPFSAAANARSSPALSTASKPSPVPFDDGGEPDFAGWLAAQSMAKAKKPLPKGLNKTSTTATSKPPATKPKIAAPAKKIDTRPKEEDDDGWGDAWD